MNHGQNNIAVDKLPVVVHILAALDYGGVERHMELIAHAMPNSYFQHIFVAIGRGGATEKNLLNIGAKVICLDQKSNIPSTGALWALFCLFRHLRPFAVHAHGAEANFHALPVAWLAGIQVRIGEEIGIPRHSRKARWIFRQVYRVADRVIGISQSVVDWLVYSGEVPRKKTVKIFNPVQLPDARGNVVDTPSVFRIGFVGRLEAVKNVLSLFTAFENILSDSVTCELWVIGDGSERAELERRVAKAKLKNVVRIFGYQADPASLLRQCHVYVQPSLSEGFGLAIVEAMGCGLPVIATAVGGAPEILKHGHTGWLLPEPSPGCIANAIRQALRMNWSDLYAMGAKARIAVIGRFEPVAYLSDMDALYNHPLRK